eukprot:1016547-Rhodomonas_salina.1
MEGGPGAQGTKGEQGGRQEGREKETWKSSTADCGASERRASGSSLQSCRRRCLRRAVGSLRRVVGSAVSVAVCNGKTRR